MAFNSIDYIVFVVIVFALFWRLADRFHLRTGFLLVASYLFYTAWNGLLVGLILLSSAIDYVCGALIARYTHRHQLRQSLLVLSLGLNLGILGFFKYSNFFIDNVIVTLNVLGFDAPPAHLDLVLPIGISFYTFQSMSYTIDVYRGVLEPTRSAKSFFLFVAFFPQLVAGPIVRARELLPQLDRVPRLSSSRVAEAFYRMLRGLVKKMVIADYLAAVWVDPLFQSPAGASALQTLLGLVAFHFQVYCDFSGYTDIAIGSAGLFGFKLPENFDTPYMAHTPANYWRRWHMTLSRYCFDYIYAPLGGSRFGIVRTHINTLITFSVIGLWHGANWNYLLFGVYHAVGVIATRHLTTNRARVLGVNRAEVDEDLMGDPLAIFATNLFIVGSLPLFRAPDLATAGVVYRQLLNVTSLNMALSWGALFMLLVAIVSHFAPPHWEIQIQRRFEGSPATTQAALVFFVTLFVLHMGTIAQQSFVYFQF